MKLINLPRELVYTDRRTLDDFLREDDLNKELYKVYLQVKDKPECFSFDAVKAFNEAYYIATIAMNESHPEEDVIEWRYIAKHDMGSAYAAHLVLSMVYAILYLQENKSENIENVLNQMQNQNYGKDHFPYFRAMAEGESHRFKSDFSIRPCPIDDIDDIVMDASKTWFSLTKYFDQTIIKNLVSFFPTIEERLNMIELIERKQTEEESYYESLSSDTLIGSDIKKADKSFYDTLREEVRQGKLKTSYTFFIWSRLNKRDKEHTVTPQTSEGEKLSDELQNLKDKIDKLELFVSLLSKDNRNLTKENNELSAKNKELEAKIHEMSATLSEDNAEDNSKQFTNRQLLIFFESLMDISLSSCGDNVKAISKLISRFAGRSPESIRQLAMRFKDDDKQSKQDAKDVAEIVRPVKPQIAAKILKNIDE